MIKTSEFYGVEKEEERSRKGGDNFREIETEKEVVLCQLRVS